MGARGRALNWPIFFIGLIIGALVGYVVISLRKKRRPKISSHAEYWIYLPGSRLPHTERIMMNMVGENPYGQLSHREGLVFSDVRLHVGLALRKRNPHVFRPDLLEYEVEPNAEVLNSLSQAQSMARISFGSDEPLADTRHLTFLPHMAAAIADLADGLAIFDTVMEKIWTVDEFRDRLKDAELEAPAFHVRSHWQQTPEGCCIGTKGLRKLGRAEWRTGWVECDQEMLLTRLMDRAHEPLWQGEETVELEEFGDTFILEAAEDQPSGKETMIEVRRRMEA